MIREPAASGKWTFGRCWFGWTPGVVEVNFHDGRLTRGDYGHLPATDADSFAETARLCGYDSPVAYAVHHDFSHCWLAEALWGIASPTLWAVAHNEPPPWLNRSEEYLVNTTQWVLATGNREYRAEYLRQIVGPDYDGVLDKLAGDLDRLADRR